MADYSKTVNFAAKDALISGNPNKAVQGTELNTEFDNIATASNTKADKASPTFTGTVNTAATVSTVDDAINSATTSPQQLIHTTSGTPANGIGVSTDYVVETTAGNNETGMVLGTVVTDVTATSEDFDFVVDLMAAGAPAAEKFRVSSAGVVTAATFNGGLVGPVIGDVLGNVQGNVTGNTSGTAATVTTAAQPAITSLGTLTSLDVTGTLDSGAATFAGDVVLDQSLTFSAAAACSMLMDSNLQSLFIAAGVAGNTGANIRLNGSSATNPNDMQFRASSAMTLYYDHSATTWDFQANDITTTGTLDSGAATFAGTLDSGALTVATSSDVVARLQLNNNASAAPQLTIFKESTTPAIGDVVCKINMEGNNDADEETKFARLTGEVRGVTDGAEEGRFDISAMNGGSLDVVGRFTGASKATELFGTLDSGAATITGNSSITGTLDVSGNTIIGSTSVTPDGTLHVHSGSAGSVSAYTGATELVVEGKGSVGASFLSTDNNYTKLYFGSPSNALGAFLRWGHDDNEFRVSTNKVGASLILRADDGVPFLTGSGASGSELATFAGDVTLSEGAVSITDTANETALSVTSSATSTYVTNITAGAVTGGQALRVVGVDALTTGKIAHFRSNSSSISTRTLVQVHNDNTAATGATALTVTQDAAQRALYIDQNGAAPAIEVDMGTNDAPFLNCVATADADTTSAISTLTTSGATTGHIQIEINGVKAWISVSTNAPS